MTKKERAAWIARYLESLYPNPPIPLVHDDEFTLLIAVLLSAQCTDQRVNEVTPGLFKLGNTPAALSKKSVKSIESIIRPCGLAPRKAKAIRDLSSILEKQFAGKVPADFELLEQLPGVGHKTASVVMAQAFGVPAFPVDTHIHRLAQRWELTNGNNVVQTEKDLKRLFPMDRWNDLHLQIIYYGREHCTARGCDGTVCEICRTCFPTRKRAKKVKKA